MGKIFEESGEIEISLSEYKSLLLAKARTEAALVYMEVAGYADKDALACILTGDTPCTKG